jgi:hypothetical protein
MIAHVSAPEGCSHSRHTPVTVYGLVVGTVTGVNGDETPVTCVVRLWLPDRPGALGQVASRVGSLRGDVVGIDILERGGGRAVDELTLSLPDAGLIDLLLTEIGQVDGVAVEDIWVIDGERPDAGVVALTVAAELAGAPVERRFEVLGRGLLGALGAQWAVLVDGDAPLVTMGPVPDLGWLSAFLAGSRHLVADAAPGDLAWAPLGDDSTATVVIGRSGRPFHARERQHVALLARIAGTLTAELKVS